MKRRMIATEIVSEGRFLRMSLTAQALYMHLLANADDDGCVDAYTITRMIGAKEDDLVLLKEREYITILDEKEYILWITGWQDFNWIEPRYKEDSKYLPLLRAKVEGLDIVESTKTQYNKRRYADRKLLKKIKDSSTQEVHSVHTVDALGSTREDHHLGKDRLGKDREDTNTTSVAIAPRPENNEVYLYWETTIGEITNTQETQRKASVTLLNRYGLDKCQKMIRIVAAAHSDKYARKESKPLSLSSLLNNWDKVAIYAKGKFTQATNNQPI